MKKIYLILLLSVLFFSCKKESISPTVKAIEGIWEYESFIGFDPILPLPPGNGRIIFIGSDRTFERRNFDTLILRSTYSLDQKRDCFGEEQRLFFKTTDPYFFEGFISIENNKLIVSSSNCISDGGITTYRKK